MSDVPVVGDLALTCTPFDCKRFVRLVLSQNDGTSVENSVVALGRLVVRRVLHLVLERALDRVALRA